jgi:RNase P protein component
MQFLHLWVIKSRIVSRRAVARHKYRRSVNHIRKTVKAHEVRDEISVVLVLVGITSAR